MLTWGRLSDLVSRKKGLELNSVLFLVFSNKDTQLFAMDLNTGDPNISDYGQLFLHGLDAEGQSLKALGGDYADMTKDIKSSLGLPIDRITLYQEGDFYKTWEFIQSKEGFTLRADTMKTDEDGITEDLMERWGQNIIGLNDESIGRLAQEVLPQVIREVLRQLLQ